jgi:hypothetical protein
VDWLIFLTIYILDYHDMITTVTGKTRLRSASWRGSDIQPGQREWSIEDDGFLTARFAWQSQLARQAAGMGQQWLEAGADPLRTD